MRSACLLGTRQELSVLSSGWDREIGILAVIGNCCRGGDIEGDRGTGEERGRPVE